MLGVIIGVAALVSVISLGDVMQGFVRGELDRTTDLQLVTLAAQTGRLVNGEMGELSRLADLHTRRPGGSHRSITARTGFGHATLWTVH